jgi:hypothetical protein
MRSRGSASGRAERRGSKRPPPIAKPCRKIPARAPLLWAENQGNLGEALTELGERESGTARLEEAVANYRESLKERTRVRVPLNWARSTGNQGFALMLLAQRRGDAPSAAYYEAQLPEARALAQKLAKR